MLSYWRMLTRAQLHAYVAALAGWSLDAFDFFVFVFCLKAISGEFHSDVKSVAEGVFLTLAFRPLGALVFGWLAEKYGRRPILMLNVVSYSVVQLATAFAPNLATLLVLRAVFGFAMGGEWGVGAALALETLPARGRGFFSGLLQEGYVLGYLFASVVFWVAFVHIGWRGMFILSSASALLVLYIRYGVQESPAWTAGRSPQRASPGAIWRAAKAYFPTLLYLVVLMACFNAFSHGSQDLYPTFLQVQHGFSPAVTGAIAVVMNLGALAGGICFGTLSERLGRKRAIVLAAALTLPMIPLWAYCPDRGTARARRIPAAVHGAGRMGHRARAPERAVALLGARDPAGIRLSAGQLRHVEDGAVPVRLRGGARQRLCLHPCVDDGRGGHRADPRHGIRPRSAARGTEGILMTTRACYALSSSLLLMALLAQLPVAAESTAPERLVHRYLDVQISPDASHVASVEGDAPAGSNFPDVRELVIRQTGGGPEARIPMPCGHVPQCWPGSPAWTPDSRQLTFTVRTPASHAYSLYTVAADGSGLHRLLEFHGTLASLKYAPDGSLALLAVENARKEVGATEAGAPIAGDLDAAPAEQRIARLAGGSLQWASPADLYVYEYDWLPARTRVHRHRRAGQRRQQLVDREALRFRRGRRHAARHLHTRRRSSSSSPQPTVSPDGAHGRLHRRHS